MEDRKDLYRTVVGKYLAKLTCGRQGSQYIDEDNVFSGK
jgi:hypothetical protein